VPTPQPTAAASKEPGNWDSASCRGGRYDRLLLVSVKLRDQSAESDCVVFACWDDEEVGVDAAQGEIL